MSLLHPATLVPRVDRGPLRVMFVVTSMPVGGAETLLVNLIRRMDRSSFTPEVCCLKERGPLGDELTDEVAVHSELISTKYDLGVVIRLARLFRDRNVDAVVTVGAGDKMFWGRIAARRARVPVICSALHSTGWPDGVGYLNRTLTRITDAFIGVAEPHGRHLVETEKFPREKVVVIPNGIDLDRFSPLAGTAELRGQLELAETAPVVGIVAALRPEKNHLMFLEIARRVVNSIADTRFLVVGDGPMRPDLEQHASDLGLADNIRFLGTRDDIPELLGLMDVFALTSHNEASPVSILESLAMRTPVVATDVGSVHEAVRDGETGFLVRPGDIDQFSSRVVELLDDPVMQAQFGAAGREHVVSYASLEKMVRGYERLISQLYDSKSLGLSASAADCVGDPQRGLSSGTTGGEIH